MHAASMPASRIGTTLNGKSFMDDTPGTLRQGAAFGLLPHHQENADLRPPLLMRKMVPWAGIEPATHSLGNCCSIQLSYQSESLICSHLCINFDSRTSSIVGTIVGTIFFRC